MPNKQPPTILIPLLLFLFALALRLHGLTFNSIWLDEAFTYFFIQHGWTEMFWLTPTDCHPPLFYWVTKAVMVFGTGDWWLRIGAAIAGALTVPVFYFIGREYSCGIVAGVLLAISPFHVAYSQEARMYTLLLLVFSISFLYYLRKRYVVAAVLGGVCLWIHFYSAVSYLMLWVVQKKDLVRSAVAYVLVALPLAVFISTILVGKTQGPPQWGWPGYHLIIEGFQQVLGYGYVLPAVMTVLVLMGCCYLWGNDRFRLFQLVAFIIGVVLLSAGISYLMPMAPRYLITLMPALFLLAGLGVREMEWVGVVVLAVVVILSASGLCTYYHIPVKDDWRPVVPVVQGAPVAVVGPEFYPAFENVVMYHAMPLQYYCPSCDVVPPVNATYIVAVNNAVVNGTEIHNAGGLRVYTHPPNI